MENKDKIKKEKILKIVRLVAIYLIMSAFAVIMLLPFYWSIITALRPYEETIKTPISFIPKQISLDNFKTFFEKEDVFGAIGNTVAITAIGMFTNLFFGSLAGYSFAKLKFRGRKIIFKIMLMSLMLPSIVTILPTFYILAKFPLAGGNDILGSGGSGFIGNILSVVLPGAIGVYGIFFMRQFFNNAPTVYGEAARIDGASELQIFYKIYLPQVVPGLITLGIFTFNSYWNSYLWPSIVLMNSDVKVLSLLLGHFQNVYINDFGSLMAGSIIIMLPVLLIFIFAQKYFMNTVTFAGIKE